MKGRLVLHTETGRMARTAGVVAAIDDVEEVLVRWIGWTGAAKPEWVPVADLEEVETRQRVARILPVLEALAMGLRVKSRGETWAMNDDLDIVAIRRHTATVDGVETVAEVGLRPLGLESLGSVIRLFEDIAPDDRTELLANAALNKVNGPTR